MKTFAELTEREILAVAIASEEEDSRIYMSFAEDLAERYPPPRRCSPKWRRRRSANGINCWKCTSSGSGRTFRPSPRGREGLSQAPPAWLSKNLPLDTIRKEAENMEFQAQRFYQKAAEQTRDVNIRKLLGDLAAVEQSHRDTAGKLESAHLTESARDSENRTRHRMFVLQYVQPGLAASWTGRCRRWRRCSPPPSPRTTIGRRFW